MDTILVDRLDARSEPADQTQITVLSESILQKLGPFLPPLRNQPVSGYQRAYPGRLGQSYETSAELAVSRKHICASSPVGYLVKDFSGKRELGTIKESLSHPQKKSFEQELVRGALSHTERDLRLLPARAGVRYACTVHKKDDVASVPPRIRRIQFEGTNVVALDRFRILALSIKVEREIVVRVVIIVIPLRGFPERIRGRIKSVVDIGQAPPQGIQLLSEVRRHSLAKIAVSANRHEVESLHRVDNRFCFLLRCGICEPR
jgi:hypothetical protein